MLKEKDSFFNKVYKIARQIPSGRVTTYGKIANHLGTGLSARMVGWAMNHAHSQAIPVPAHRVVNRNGMLTGKNHFATPDLMEQLLKAEGVLVEDDRVVDFEEVLWEPR